MHMVIFFQPCSSPELPSVTSPRSLSGGEFVYFYQGITECRVYIYVCM